MATAWRARPVRRDSAVSWKPRPRLTQGARVRCRVPDPQVGERQRQARRKAALGPPAGLGRARGHVRRVAGPEAQRRRGVGVRCRAAVAVERQRVGQRGRRAAPENAAGADEPGQAARRVGAAGETEHIDFIVFAAVIGEKAIAVHDVGGETQPQCTAADGIGATGRPDPFVVEHHLSRAAIVHGPHRAHHLHHVGRVGALVRRVPGAIETDYESALRHGLSPWEVTDDSRSSNVVSKKEPV